MCIRLMYLKNYLNVKLVTYKEDKETVVKAIRDLKDKGLYPEKLWEEYVK